MANIEKAGEWEKQSADPGSSRPHWFLHNPEGHPYDWTIVKLKDGFWLCNDPWPPVDAGDLRPTLVAGPYPKLDVAKVAYRMNVGAGNVPDWVS